MARILIVEDNEPNLELMSYLLRAFGHSVIAARDGDSGLALAQTEKVDLILCDVQLPGISGTDLARRVRGDAAWRKVPLIAVTALAMVGDREAIMAAGFDGYFTKPITPDTFVQQVDAFLPPDLRGKAATVPSETVAASASAPQGRTILVTDDVEAQLDLASSLFGGSGYKVITAFDMTEALRLAREAAPDLILSDVCMAGGSGFDFLQAIKADPQLAAIPFVFLTSTMTNESARKRGLAMGAVRYLFRPVEPGDLLREIAACLGAPRAPV